MKRFIIKQTFHYTVGFVIDAESESAARALVTGGMEGDYNQDDTLDSTVVESVEELDK